MKEEQHSDFHPEWCQELLEDPSYTQSNALSRKPGESHGTRLSLMSRTLFTENTIRAVRVLYKPLHRSMRESRDALKDSSNDRLGGELLMLISLGDELGSHPGIVHGGMVMVLVDEVGGGIVSHELTHPDTIHSANFNINMRKSVRAPGILLGRAWIERAPERRKVWVKVRLEQDDGICAEGEVLYVRNKPRAKM